MKQKRFVEEKKKGVRESRIVGEGKVFCLERDFFYYHI